MMQQGINAMPPAIKNMVEEAIKEKLNNLRTSAQVTHDVYDAKFF
jgi:long-chain acyl-CoA synthetase